MRSLFNTVLTPMRLVLVTAMLAFVLLSDLGLSPHLILANESADAQFDITPDISLDDIHAELSRRFDTAQFDPVNFSPGYYSPDYFSGEYTGAVSYKTGVTSIASLSDRGPMAWLDSKKGTVVVAFLMPATYFASRVQPPAKECSVTVGSVSNETGTNEIQWVFLCSSDVALLSYSVPNTELAGSHLSFD